MFDRTVNFARSARDSGDDEVERAAIASPLDTVGRGNVKTLDQYVDKLLPAPTPTSLLSIAPEEFLALAKAAKVVSFDVFDTLLHRQVVLPRDIFGLTGNRIGVAGFADARFAAEANARRSARPATVEVCLDEIYRAFPAGSLPDADLARKTELEVESEFIFANEAMLSMVKKLRAAGRRVIAVSDTYLGSHEVGALLAAKGYEIDAVYASSDYRAGNLGKYNGALYPVICREEGIEPHELLHAGDHAEADVVNALGSGAVAVQAHHPSAFLAAHNEHFAVVMREHESLSSSVIAGTVAKNKLGDRARLTSSLDTFAYDFGGPLVVGFVAHIIERCRELGIEHLALLTRDGCVVGDVLDALAPEGLSYRLIPASRRLTMFPAFAEGDIHKIKSLFAGQKMITKRRLLAVLRLDELADGIEGADTVIHFKTAIEELKPVLLEQAKAERAALLDFLEPERKLLEAGRKFAWVDVGWALSAPQRLNEMLGHDVPAFFIGSHAAANRSPGFDGYLFGRGRPHDVAKVVMRSVEVIELIFADWAPSAAYLKQSANGIETVHYRKSPAESVRDACVKSVRREIRRFAEDVRHAFASLDPEDLRAYNRSVWKRLCTDPPPSLYKVLSVVPHDNLAGTKVWNTIGDQWLPSWRYGTPDKKAFPTRRTYRIAYLRRYLKWHLPPRGWEMLRWAETVLRKFI